MSSKKSKSKKAAVDVVENLVAISEDTNVDTVETAMATSTAPAEIESNSATTVVETAEVPVVKKAKALKSKVIRDSFSFPEQDYRKISELKKNCLAAGMHVKKGEILRAGLHLLSNLEQSELTKVLERVEKVQTGRPRV